MRIISGTLKGRQFNIKLAGSTRPCTDQAKGSLFNFLSSALHSNYIFGADLFAGTGSMGYEMISRKLVQHMLFVDHYKNCTDFIKKQCIEFDISENTTVIRSDVFKFIRKYNEMHNHKLDIIFAGPPYGMNADQYNQIPTVIFDQAILDTNHGLLILEHDKRVSFHTNPNFIVQKAFRSTYFSFFSHNRNLFA
eukprot:26270_1